MDGGGGWRWGWRHTVDALVPRQYVVHTARQVRGQGLACRSSGWRVRKSGISARTQRIDRYPYCSGAGAVHRPLQQASIPGEIIQADTDAIERGVLWATGIQPEKHRTAAIDQVLTVSQTGP